MTTERASERDGAEDCARCASVSSRRARPAIGPPFVDCLRCGRQVVRPHTTEWDFHGPRERWSLIGHRASLAVLIGAAFPLGHGLASALGPGPWNRAMALWTLALGWVTCASAAALWLLLEIRRSRRRVARDPMYRARLVRESLTASRTELAEEHGLGAP